MSDTSNSGDENISKKELLKRLTKLERKYRKTKRRHRERTRSRSNSCSRSVRDYRSPSGSESRNYYKPRSRSRDSKENRHTNVDRQIGDYRSLYGSGSRNENNNDRALHSPATVLSVDDHNPRDVASPVDTADTRREQGNTVDPPVPCERSPLLQLHNTEDISEEFLEILGDDPENEKQVTFNIHPALGSRWGHIVKHGIANPDKDKLLERYPLPNNCPNLTPPILNPEIKTILSNSLLKRDQAYLESQTQMCKGISALAKGIEEVLADKENMPCQKKSKLLEYLGDSGRILSDLVYRETQTRRHIILPSLSKPVKDLVENIPPNEYLFGADLGEKIKTAKELEKTSKQLKPEQGNFPAYKSSYKIPSKKFSGRGGGGARPEYPSGNKKANNAYLNRGRPARQQRDPRPKGQTSRADHQKRRHHSY